MSAVFSGWQIAPLVRWQSGSRFTVTTGVDNALSGMGGQRAVQVLGRRVRRRHREQLPEPRRLHLAGGRHLQHAEAERVRRARRGCRTTSASAANFRFGGAGLPVPLGNLQRA